METGARTAAHARRVGGREVAFPAIAVAEAVLPVGHPARISQRRRAVTDPPRPPSHSVSPRGTSHRSATRNGQGDTAHANRPCGFTTTPGE
ncbi:hypothetical protein Rrhod_3135 [Rhodococcus rhodnii LMG 5362]|uniref:Uncharacterized protein n=1 Tax=Rhodococcus rhodnii LMG 5362 TaxID=1273125 RepID=R7WJ89_9NOCA|nr:hypothetical protein Rrhod_3135 [Rhodococcus rhodnii LMG 5362]